MSHLPKSVTVIGASHAGVTAVEALRKNGFSGEITLISAESALPYHRPPLSKALLSGEKAPEQIALRGAKFYEDADVQFLRETKVTQIDANAKTLRLSNETVLPWDQLILATGARARRLPGTEGLSGVYALRDMVDAAALQKALHNRARLVVVGGGFIGLEVAATFVKAGAEVTLIEPLPALLRRALPPEISDFLAAYHRQQGLDLRLGTSVSEVLRAGDQISGLRLSTGEVIETDHLLVGIGSTARLELAEQLGLDLHLGGIRVDAYGASSLPGVWAIGDCATQFNHCFGDWARIESVQIAADQARATAAQICGAKTASASEALPWFWSDQYDLKLQMAGFVQEGRNSLLRGSPAQTGFSVLHHQSGQLKASFSVNRAGDHIQSRKLISEGALLDLDLCTNPAMGLQLCRQAEGAA